MTALLDIAVDEKRHGARTILRNFHLRLEAGEIVSLIGASGCGKSSLLSIASGLDSHYRGGVRLRGAAMRGTHAEVGLIFQEPRLFPWLTVEQNIVFGAADAPDAARVAALLEEVGLSGYGTSLPKQLSGGQAQRVAIARGLYTRPRVLLVTHDIDEALYLSDRIVLMDGVPGPARAEFEVGHARPRDRAVLATSTLKPAILDSLHAVHAI